mgnify:CR=1 FL=1
MDIYKQTIKHKSLNKGKKTVICHDYEKDYFTTQFSEIFIEGHYADGLKKKNPNVDNILYRLRCEYVLRKMRWQSKVFSHYYG